MDKTWQTEDGTERQQCNRTRVPIIPHGLANANMAVTSPPHISIQAQNKLYILTPEPASTRKFRHLLAMSWAIKNGMREGGGISTFLVYSLATVFCVCDIRGRDHWRLYHTFAYLAQVSSEQGCANVIPIVFPRETCHSLNNLMCNLSVSFFCEWAGSRVELSGVSDQHARSSAFSILWVFVQ